MDQNEITAFEPWLRGTLSDIPAVPRAVLHALELAKEDLNRWAVDLSDKELNLRPFGTASVAFHMRHIARSLDRLLSYAEGHALNAEQFSLLKSEETFEGRREELFEEFSTAIGLSTARVKALASFDLSKMREVGSKKLPSTLGGLLVHVADHTQRHVGQAITTAKIVSAQRGKQVS